MNFGSQKITMRLANFYRHLLSTENFQYGIFEHCQFAIDVKKNSSRVIENLSNFDTVD